MVRNLFACRPLDSFPPSQIYPRIAQNTLEVSGASQCGPRAKGRRGRPDSGDLADSLGRGSCWGGSRVHGCLIWVLTCGGEKTDGQAWRKPAAAAAGMVTPVSLRSSLSNKRVCKLQRVLGEVVAALVGNDKDRKMELAVRVSHGAAAAARLWRSAHGRRPADIYR
jgi:hypothetical protein